ncbi:L-type lectin-domain containing receptor kinase IV.2-like [Cryptomeria japonica]|uniref:L-type lectin-domain containing receptor kinase IV.2-like n=1 Tax=Cryptomeria japonica TaxID=3369 RepID=UPI0027DA76C1|nr:L-type lectin-domain containing receptor kinase IV.2-like [Cryptomeria japonica]
MGLGTCGVTRVGTRSTFSYLTSYSILTFLVLLDYLTPRQDRHMDSKLSFQSKKDACFSGIFYLLQHKPPTQKKQCSERSNSIAKMQILILCLSIILTAAQGVHQNTTFVFNHFNTTTTIKYVAAASIQSNAIRLTNHSKRIIGRAYLDKAVPMKRNGSVISFSTSFIFAIVPHARSGGADGLCFVMTPTTALNGAFATQYLGLLNISSDGKDHNQLFAAEFDTSQSIGVDNKDGNHVGIDLNGVKSLLAEPAGYWEGNSLTPINLKSGHNIRAWIDYDDASNQLDISIAAIGEAKPQKALVSKKDLDLDGIIEEYVYVGFSASTDYATFLFFNVKQNPPDQGICHSVLPQGFRDDNLLGDGGFGKVYRGTLPSGEEIAVKCITKDLAEGMEEFMAEISSLGRLQHRNLVALRGWCRKNERIFIIYDYISNGSLERNLYSPEMNLTWPQRHKILTDVAGGLLYLHEQWDKCVVHRDIKSSNVLLDTDLNGRVGDFGLARLYDHSQRPQTTHVVGTLGYIAPELIHSGKASPSTDVFSFGALMLEVACGRKPVDAQGVILVEWVWDLYANERLLDAIDQRLGENYDKDEAEIVLVLGLICSNPDPQKRLGMRKVLQILCGEAALPMGLPAPSAF